MATKQGTMIELFAGIGGFRLGLEKHGWETLFANQWEPGKKKQWAFECYAKHFPSSNNSNVDIAQVDAKDIPDHDLLVGGFPCQDYSVAATLATSKGIEGKKGVLWWEIRRIVEEKHPKYILLENVDRLLKSPASQRGRDFGIILSCLNGLGYTVEWRVINAAEYGFPQRRRRTFIFATNVEKLKETLYGGNDYLQAGFFSKPFPCAPIEESKRLDVKIPKDLVKLSSDFGFLFENSGVSIDYKATTQRVAPTYSGPFKTIGEILEHNVPKEYCLNEKDLETWKYMKGAKSEERMTSAGFSYHYSEGPIAYPDFLDRPSRTMLTTESGKNRMTHVVKDLDSGLLRVLTPTECERLDGFPDGWTDTGMPHKFRYFCLGNALVVGLIDLMGEHLTELAKDC